MMGFVRDPLRNAAAARYQKAASPPNPLFKRAKEVDHPAVAVTDHGTLTALYDAYLASQDTGVKLIPDMEAYFTDDLSSKKNYQLNEER